MRPHALRRDVLGRLDLESERVAIEAQRGVEIGDGDADVIECRPSSVAASPVRPSRRAGGSAPMMSSTARVGIGLARGDPIEHRARTPPAPARGRARAGRSDAPAARCTRHSARARRRSPVRRRGVRAESLDRRRPARRRPCRWSLRSSRSAAATAPRRTTAARACASIDATVRSAPSRSALLTTKMSAISMMPAFSACTSSPAPGTSSDDRRCRRCGRCRLRPGRRRPSR